MKLVSTGKAALATLAMGITLLATHASAQPQVLRFDVPFTFAAGNQVLAAGQYWLTVNTDQLIIRPTIGTALTLVRLGAAGISRPAAKAENASLRFQKVGGRYFLVGVWKPGSVQGNDVTTSRRLLESAKAEAGGNAETSTLDIR